MDPQVSTSFIPKKPLTGERTRTNGFGFIILIAILLFIASGAAAGGVFLYGQVLKGQLTSKKSQLEQAQSAYDPGVIEDLVRLDARMSQGRTLLGKHIAPSSIFMLLSEQTLEGVQFTSFSYTTNEAGGAEIEMKGRARDFSTVALQSDQFGSNKLLREVVFSGIAIGEAGGVSFAVSAIIDNQNLLYSKYLNQTVFVPPPATTTQSMVDESATSSTSASTTPSL